MRRKMLFPVLILCGSVILLGCSNSFDGMGETATLHIVPGGTNARAAAASDLVSQIKSYAVTISGGVNPPPTASFDVGEAIVFTGVKIANGYTVTMIAHNMLKESQTSSTVLGSGWANFNVGSANAQVSVIVAAGTVTQNTGRGSVDLLIQYPKSEGIESVRASLSGASSVNATVTPYPALTTVSYDAVQITVPAIQSGQYSMFVVFDRGLGKSKVSLSEEVFIYDNGITNRWIIDSAGRYDTVRVYDNIFSSTYPYLADIRFNLSGQIIIDPTDFHYTSLPFFMSEKTSDVTNYVVHCAEDSFQFLPLPGYVGQTIMYAWSNKSNGGDSDDELTWQSIQYPHNSDAPPSIVTANGSLYIKVTAGDTVATGIYRIQIIKDYKIFYNGNTADGGTPPDTKTYRYGDVARVIGNSGGLTKTGLSFNGWNTKADGSGTTYFAGDDLSPIDSSLTLYARWTLSSLMFVVKSINPDAAVLLFDLPSQTPVIHKNGITSLTVNLASDTVVYKQNVTVWSYTTGGSIIPTIISSANAAANKNIALVWTPASNLVSGDYTFTVFTVIMLNGKEFPCTGYFKVTVAD